MDSLREAGSGTRAVEFDGTSAYMGVGNPEELQVEGAVTLEACVLNAADPRPGQRRMPHRNIIAHGHDRVTEARHPLPAHQLPAPPLPLHVLVQCGADSMVKWHWRSR